MVVTQSNIFKVFHDFHVSAHTVIVLKGSEWTIVDIRSRTLIFYQLNLNSGFQSHLSVMPDSLSCTQDCKAHDSGFHNQKFPGFRNPNSLTLGDINHCKLASNCIVFSPYD